MTPKTQSVCKHCSRKISKCTAIRDSTRKCKGYIHTATGFHFCNMAKCTSVAEPASTGEPKCAVIVNDHGFVPDICGLPLGHKGKHEYIEAVRPSEPSAPQTSAEDEALPREAAPILAALFNSLIEQNCPDSVSGYTIFDAMWPKIQAAAPQLVSPASQTPLKAETWEGAAKEYIEGKFLKEIAAKYVSDEDLLIVMGFFCEKMYDMGYADALAIPASTARTSPAHFSDCDYDCSCGWKKDPDSHLGAVRD